MYIRRTLANRIESKFFRRRMIVLYGPRRVGKTTLVKEIIRNRQDAGYFNADLINEREIWKPKSVEYLKQIVAGHKVIVIDEAQNIPDVGLVLKVLVDNFPDVQFIATGSSSFDLQNTAGEPLTGRKWQFFLYPFSFDELVKAFGLFEAKSKLDTILTFGLYPETILNPTEAKEILSELISSYLLKDVFAWGNIKKSDKLMNLLKALAYQIGSTVSYKKLSNLTGLDVGTVERYIDILEKNFIIFRLLPFGGNLRGEIKKQRKVFFWDIGVRNAIIGQFLPFDTLSPQERGRIWENFIISEMIKLANNYGEDTQFYFWRTKDGAEVDLVAINSGRIFAYEIKLGKTARLPRSFVKYKPAGFEVIRLDNFAEFLIKNDVK